MQPYHVMSSTDKGFRWGTPGLGGLLGPQPFLNHLIFFLSFIQPQNIAFLAKHFMVLLYHLYL